MTVFLRIALLNLFNNVIKFSRAKANPLVEFGSFNGPYNSQIFYGRDYGVGFDMQCVGRLFEAFQRLHVLSEYVRMNIWLATVVRIIQCHHGEIWAEAEVGKGATIYFTLSDSKEEKKQSFLPLPKGRLIG